MSSKNYLIRAALETYRFALCDGLTELLREPLVFESVFKGSDEITFNFKSDSNGCVFGAHMFAYLYRKSREQNKNVYVHLPSVFDTEKYTGEMATFFKEYDSIRSPVGFTTKNQRPDFLSEYREGIVELLNHEMKPFAELTGISKGQWDCGITLMDEYYLDLDWNEFSSITQDRYSTPNPLTLKNGYFYK